MPGFVSDSGSCSTGELERCGLSVRILRGSDGKKALGLPSGCPWRWVVATLLCAIAFLAPAAAAARDLVVYGEPTLEKALKSVGSVPVGNLRSEILMVESAQNWHRQRAPDSLNGPRDRRVLVQR